MWRTEDNVTKDIRALSQTYPTKIIANAKRNANTFSQMKSQFAKSKHTSIYDDYEEVQHTNSGRGITLNHNMNKASNSQIVLKQHIQETKSHIREVMPYNFSNEYIEKALTSVSHSGFGTQNQYTEQSNSTEEKVTAMEEQKPVIAFKPLQDNVIHSQNNYVKKRNNFRRNRHFHNRDGKWQNKQRTST